MFYFIMFNTLINKFLLFITVVCGRTVQSLVFKRYGYTDSLVPGSTAAMVRSKIDCGVECSLRDTCQFFYYSASLKLCRLAPQSFIDDTKAGTAEYEVYFQNGGIGSISLPFFVCPATSGDQVTAFSQDAMQITFRVFTEYVRQPVASQACETFGERLMRIKTREKQTLVALVLSSCTAFSNSDFHIDGSADRTNMWRYSDGSNVPMDNTYLWRDSAPNNPMDNNCVRMAALIGFRWEDLSCETLFGYICEPI